MFVRACYGYRPAEGEANDCVCVLRLRSILFTKTLCCVARRLLIMPVPAGTTLMTSWMKTLMATYNFNRLAVITSLELQIRASTRCKEATMITCVGGPGELSPLVGWIYSLDAPASLGSSRVPRRPLDCMLDMQIACVISTGTVLCIVRARGECAEHPHLPQSRSGGPQHRAP